MGLLPKPTQHWAGEAALLEKGAGSQALLEVSWVTQGPQGVGGGSQGTVAGQMCTLDPRAPVMLGAPQTEAHTHQDSTARGREVSRSQEPVLNKPLGGP